jgi:hypothetical protein
MARTAHSSPTSFAVFASSAELLPPRQTSTDASHSERIHRRCDSRGRSTAAPARCRRSRRGSFRADPARKRRMASCLPGPISRHRPPLDVEIAARRQGVQEIRHRRTVVGGHLEAAQELVDRLLGLSEPRKIPLLPVERGIVNRQADVPGVIFRHPEAQRRVELEPDVPRSPRREDRSVDEIASQRVKAASSRIASRYRVSEVTITVMRKSPRRARICSGKSGPRRSRRVDW